MKILAIVILRREPSPSIILAGEYDVSSFSFFQRTSVQEFLAFFATTLSDKTAPGMRQAVEQDIYTGYVYTHGGQGLSGVIITDHSYPQRVAFQVLNQVLDEFLQRYPKSHWAATTGIPTKTTTTSSMNESFKSMNESSRSIVPVTPFPALKGFMQKFQDPHEADAILKVQRDIDETKVILHKTIESMLARGERLDNLVDKSERLSAQSKAFYKVAQKTNTCSCTIQ